jgi:hypothetical protein
LGDAVKEKLYGGYWAELALEEDPAPKLGCFRASHRQFVGYEIATPHARFANARVVKPAERVEQSVRVDLGRYG